MVNKNYYSIFVIVGFISCFLLGCLNRASDFLSENKSGIYFYIQQDNDKVIGLVGVPKDNKSLVVCVDKKTCEFKDGEIVGVDFVEDLENAKIYKIKDSINLSSKIEVIRDNSNKRKVEISESKGSFSDVNVGDLKIIQLTKRTNSNNSAYGDVLNDIISYYGDMGNRCDGDTKSYSPMPTYAHEATHGLNSCIRNNHNTTGKRANGFYLLEGKAVVVEEPTNMKITTVASFVPNELRNLDVTNRYDGYIAFSNDQGRMLKPYWDNISLYIFDEWVAYLNGARESINLIQSNKAGGTGGDSGLINGAIEFMVYASALVKALSEKDSSYLQSNTQFKALYKYLFKTTVSVYNQGKGNSRLVGSEAETYMNKFKNSDLYKFVKSNFSGLDI